MQGLNRRQGEKEEADKGLGGEEVWVGRFTLSCTKSIDEWEIEFNSDV